MQCCRGRAGRSRPLLLTVRLSNLAQIAATLLGRESYRWRVTAYQAAGRQILGSLGESQWRPVISAGLARCATDGI